MVGKLEPEDRVLPEWFAQTSDKPYDRHTYELVFNDGRKSIIFDDYDQMRLHWFECVRNWGDCKVNVLDIKKQKKKSKGGFK